VSCLSARIALWGFTLVLAFALTFSLAMTLFWGDTLLTSSKEHSQILPARELLPPEQTMPITTPSSTRLSMVSEEDTWCTWSTPTSKFLFPYDFGIFCNETYSVLNFLHEEMFLNRGFWYMPMAGTALGAVRHGGTFWEDDDLDITVFLAKEMKTWLDVRRAFQEGIESYRLRHPNFTWYIYNNSKVQAGTEKCPVEGYSKCLTDMDKRVSFLEMRTHNKKEQRKMFWGETLPNHMVICGQPHEYLQKSVVYTANALQSFGGWCKCRFGLGSILCPKKLPEFVKKWYGEGWKKRVGPITTRGGARKKSWLD